MFIGRNEAMTLLQQFTQKMTASLLRGKGARRIDKTCLIEEFAKPFKFYSFNFNHQIEIIF